MNFDAWKKLSLFERGIVVCIPIFLITVMFYLFYPSGYEPLFSADNKVNIDEVTSFLESENISYRVKNGDIILVPKGQVHEIRRELAIYGITSQQKEKGLDIFSGNTWIKGEKELKMLEVRALKSQLENDLSQFENVRNVNLVLDIPPTSPFKKGTNETKASVILNLVPGARLSPQTLRSITYHIASAIRGLEPNMIAISDTTGKLYQSHDPEGEVDIIWNAEVATEDHIKAKVDGLLARVIGYENFYTTVQVVMSRDKVEEDRQFITEESPNDRIKILSAPGTIESISIGVVINEAIFGNQEIEKEQLKKKIQTQINTIIVPYDLELEESTITLIPFRKQQNPTPIVIETTEKVENSQFFLVLLFIMIGLFFIGVGSVYLLLNGIKKSKKKRSKHLESLVHQVQERVKKKKNKSMQTIRDWISEE